MTAAKDTDLSSLGISTASLASDVVKHVEHIAGLAGIDHVGMGLDLDVRDPDYLPIVRQIVAGLLQRGYKPPDIGKVLGANFAEPAAATNFWDSA